MDNWKEPWMKFLEGHWQEDVPEKPGKYFVKAKDHPFAGDTRVLYKDPKTGCTMQVPGWSWGGYWWSEPIADLPDEE